MDYGKREKLIKTFLKKNKELNLSAIRTEDDVFVKHIQDALVLEKVIKFEKGSEIADIGTGGGFPLLPLATNNPDCQFVGIDARKKKTEAVKSIAQDLKLENVKLLWSRIEDVNQTYHYVVARAVAYSDKLLKRVHPLLHRNSQLILYKIRDSEEKKVLIKEAKRYGLHIDKEHHYKLFDGDIERVIYVLNKL